MSGAGFGGFLGDAQKHALCWSQSTSEPSGAQVLDLDSLGSVVQVHWGGQPIPHTSPPSPVPSSGRSGPLLLYEGFADSVWLVFFGFAEFLVLSSSPLPAPLFSCFSRSSSSCLPLRALAALWALRPLTLSVGLAYIYLFPSCYSKNRRRVCSSAEGIPKAKIRALRPYASACLSLCRVKFTVFCSVMFTSINSLRLVLTADVWGPGSVISPLSRWGD